MQQKDEPNPIFFASIPFNNSQLAVVNASESQLLWVFRWRWLFRTNVGPIDQVKSNLS